jgi:Trypsin-co-occurring domain 1
VSEVEIVEVGLPDDGALLVRAERVGAEDDGPSDVSLREFLSFSDVSAAIRGIAKEVHSAVQAVRPEVVTVEFGLDFGLKGSHLLALLVDADSKASIRVRLEWHGKIHSPDKTTGSSVK